MKVLMFGWEYPPHVFGGLATVNFTMTSKPHFTKLEIVSASP